MAIIALCSAGCASSVKAVDAPPITGGASHDLPADRASLLRISDESSADGPAGPDLGRSLAAAEAILSEDPKDSEALWRAARATVYQSLDDSSCTAQVAARCMQLGALAVRHGDSAPAHFYHALCMGLRAKAVHREGLDLVKKMLASGQMALKADAKLEHAGPHRLLGGIYLHAPAWPTSVGDPDAAIEHLEKAVELSPDWPENHLMLAQAYLEDERYDDCRATLAQARERLEKIDSKGWRERFQKQLSKLESRLAEEAS